ncbi:unnamed protein product [Linum trigynum]|uniref:Uncharacterized protein n=1 Tax=Linum trigynum TaxID=586398 RepID=A0AAV2EAJ4_9ROSI
MYKTQLEPKEKEKNRSNKKAPEHLQVTIKFTGAIQDYIQENIQGKVIGRVSLQQQRFVKKSIKNNVNEFVNSVKVKTYFIIHY